MKGAAGNGSQNTTGGKRCKRQNGKCSDDALFAGCAQKQRQRKHNAFFAFNINPVPVPRGSYYLETRVLPIRLRSFSSR